MATARVAFGEVHAELAEERVGAHGRLLDRDQALHEAPGSIEERALREQVAGGVAADVAGIRREVEELLARHRTRSRPARPSSDRPRGGCRHGSARGDRRAAPGPTASKRPPPPARGGAGRRSGSAPNSWIDANASDAPAPRMASVVPWKKPCETVSPSGLVRRPARDQLLDDRGRGAVAEGDKGSGDQRATGLGGGPAERDRRARRSRRRRRRRGGRGSRSRARAWASLSSTGRVAPPSRAARKPSGSRSSHCRHRLDPNARRERPVQRPEVVAERRRAVEEVRPRVFERRRAEVDVRGVELVGLDRQRREGRSGGEAFLAQPVGLARAPRPAVRQARGSRR